MYLPKSFMVRKHAFLCKNIPVWYSERQRTHPEVALAAIQQCAEMVWRGGGLAAVIRFIFLQLPRLLRLFPPNFRCVVGERKEGREKKNINTVKEEMLVEDTTVMLIHRRKGPARTCLIRSSFTDSLSLIMPLILTELANVTQTLSREMFWGLLSYCTFKVQ